MITYIKNNVPEKIVSFSKELDPTLYNNIGSTYEDYLNNKWVKLNRKQITYKNNHPDSSIHDIFYMIEPANTYITDLEEAKNKKIQEIKDYDKSRDIDVFYINNTIPDWLDKNQRMSIFYRLENELKLGKTNTIIWLRDIKLNISIQDAYNILLNIEDYAIACLDNTNTHIENVKKLTELDAVNNYNYKIGYPPQINIDIIL